MIKKIFACLLIFLPCIVCLSACDPIGNEGLMYDNADRYVTDIHEYVVGITKIEIRWIGGDVKVATGEVDHVVISETTSREKYPFSCKTRSYVEDEKLYIAFGEPGERNWTNVRKDLTVTFPKDAGLREVTLLSRSGDVELENTMSVERMEAETKSGKIKAEFSSLVPVEFSAKTRTGNVVATFTRTTSPTIDIETTSGRAMIVAMDVRSLDFKSSSGDLFLTIPEEVEYSATIETKFGKITSQYGEVTRGKGDVKIQAETFTGDVNIKKA